MINEGKAIPTLFPPLYPSGFPYFKHFYLTSSDPLKQLYAFDIVINIEEAFGSFLLRSG